MEIKNRRYCLTLELKNDKTLIAEYEEYHQRVWPEVLRSIADAGIEKMAIYRLGNRLVMTIEVDDSFSFERKTALDNANPEVQAWEKLMWKYQQPLPGVLPDEKWQIMNKIFEL